MKSMAVFVVTVMFLFPAGPEPENPWKDKVPAAVQKAERARTIAAYREALDVTYRADDWQAALELAHAALAEYPNEPTLSGRIARALWRGGRIEEAERVVDTIAADATDRVALTSSIEIQLARGAGAKASHAARRLEKLGPQSAVEHYYLLAMRLEDDRLEGLSTLLRKAARLVDPANGYPEIYLEELL
ncbi:MAG: tetratricopeptide repeat protein, partial [Planctomycetes bacterium]|nr:tetratricopeptide repeat protein [Planctomycetota bacterium]